MPPMRPLMSMPFMMVRVPRPPRNRAVGVHRLGPRRVVVRVMVLPAVAGDRVRDGLGTAVRGGRVRDGVRGRVGRGVGGGLRGWTVSDVSGRSGRLWGEREGRRGEGGGVVEGGDAGGKASG